MDFKLKDLVTQKINKANKQISLDIKKRVLKHNNISVEELLELKLNKKMLKHLE